MNTVILYQFNKRLNSTALPTAGDSYSFTYKSPTSVYFPVLEIHGAGDAYNYAQIGGRYFYVDDIRTISNGVWEYSLSLDALATYRQEIFNTSAFVQYDITANTEIVDNRLSAITTTQYAETRYTLSDWDDYYVAITTTGNDGSVNIFGLSMQETGDLLNQLDDWGDINLKPEGDDIGALIRYLAKVYINLFAFGNAPSNIRDAKIIHMRLGAVAGSSARIYLGKYDTGISGKKIADSSPLHKLGFPITIPWPITDWRRNPPYTELGLYIPFVGNIALPVSSLLDSNKLRVDICGNVTTGAIGVKLRGAGGNVVGTYGGNCGMSIPLGVSNVSPMTVFTCLANVAGQAAAAAGSVVSLDLGGAAGALNNAVQSQFQGLTQAFNPTPTTTGGMGDGTGFTDLTPQAICYSVFHNTNIEPNSVAHTIGTPTFAVRTLGNLSGFVKTAGCSVHADAPGAILGNLNRQIDGGVFLE